MDILEKTISKISPWQTVLLHQKLFCFYFPGKKMSQEKRSRQIALVLNLVKKKINQKKGEAKTFPIFQKRNYLIPGFDGP